MNKHKLLIGLLVAGLFTAGLGAGVFPASAEQRTYQVTYVGGRTDVVTLDLPAGTPVDQVSIPGAVSIIDITPPSVPTVPPVPTTSGPAPAPQPTQTTPDPGSKPAADSEPVGGKQQEQKVTGNEKPEAQANVETSTAKIVRATAKDATKDANRAADGTPTPNDPTYSFALPGPAPIGVPNFFIEKFRIPPFLLSIYQAAGIQYGVRWEVLAAINEIETDYGRNLNVSSAGALGWMQFMPATWKTYGVDANNDGEKDPYNPVDAIFAAARYLKAAGAATDVRRAVFAYNHADWYVDSVLLRARLVGGLPADLVGSLTGLTQGLFPVHAKARYAKDVEPAAAVRRVKSGNAANIVSPDSTRKGISIYARNNAPVVATQDAKVVGLGVSKRLGRFIQLRDVYGNTYTYGGLGEISKAYPTPKPQSVSARQVARELDLPKADPRPTEAASAGTQATPKVTSSRRVAARAKAAAAPVVHVAKERLYANPARPTAFANGGESQLLDSGAAVPGYTTFKNYFTQVFGLKRSDVVLKRLKVGSQVIAGTIIGRIGKVRGSKAAPHMRFEIRPAGKGAPRIDPKPILDGWKLLETTAIYRAAGKNPFFGRDAKNPSIGQILLMSKAALQHRVLTDPSVQVYDCGRRDIQSGGIDRRVLATIEFLAASGLKPTISSLHCGHSYLTTSGNVSEHSSGNAVDIAAVNGIPILGHQGSGSITDITIRRLLTLQGTMKPDQIISLMTYDGTDNTLALPDHNDHIHVGFRPLFDANGKLSPATEAVLKPGQWIKLIDRIGQIQNPTVRVKPSKYSITVEPPQQASTAHQGE
ncbi:MAG: peptidoglycan DD-metalloendopeptidase family protein [Solirubrobacterales bacterium]|nr:peptidoglycan DD-metalloendopeptidase family protein [Solirubrobacterales bacterium]